MTDRKKTILTMPLNRVEGDLELKLEIQHDRVNKAWSRGIMYRGFENMLKGRGPKDGLVITPRVCGICGTAHLLAAAKALDDICAVTIPPNAQIIRNITSMAEHLQSDMRHGFLMFMPDFTNPAYKKAAFFEEAVNRYEPLKGSSIHQAIRSTKRIIEIVAIIGGQWPHSSYMVPGGVASTMSLDDIVSCRYLISQFRDWYETRVLGCSVDRWLEVESREDLEKWRTESESHRNSEIGLFIRCCTELGLDELGGGYDSFLSYGQFEFPETQRDAAATMIFPPGFYTSDGISPFDQSHISEHVAYSNFEDYPGGLHPFQGATQPLAPDPAEQKYSFSKAPRYLDKPAEVGPLAELLCAQNPLFTDLVSSSGATVFSRQLARFARSATLLPYMAQWLELLEPNEPFYNPVPYIPDGRGCGLTGGCRGALGHWITIEDEKIKRYQIITPTAWNGSPRDSNALPGPWEKALLDTPIPDPENPVTVGHVIRSFDACQVCSVHTVIKNDEEA